MKRILPILLLAVFALSAVAAEPRNYSGTWRLDTAASKDLPPHFAGIEEWKLDVSQEAKTVKVRVQITSGRPDRPNVDQTLTYALDGTPTQSTTKIITPAGPREAPTTATARVAEDGTLDISVVREVSETLRGKTFEQWSLAADGRTLTVHRKDERPMGDVSEYDMVFRKSE